MSPNTQSETPTTKRNLHYVGSSHFSKDRRMIDPFSPLGRGVAGFITDSFHEDRVNLADDLVSLE